MRTLPVCLAAFCEGIVVNTPPSFSSASTPRQFPHLKPAVYAALDRIWTASVVPRAG